MIFVLQPTEKCANPVDCQFFLFKRSEDDSASVSSVGSLGGSPGVGSLGGGGSCKWQLVSRSPLLLNRDVMSNESLEGTPSW